MGDRVTGVIFLGSESYFYDYDGDYYDYYLETNFGRSIINLGDFNGDGKDDLVFIGNSCDTDDVFLVFGDVGEFESASILIDDLFSDDFTQNGINFEMWVWETSFGDVTACGDVDNDGYDDLLIQTSTASYLILGSSDRSAWVHLSEAEWDSEIITIGDTALVQAAGDFNADGYSDLVFGNPDFGSSGTVYVIAGKEDFGSDYDFEGFEDLSNEISITDSSLSADAALGMRIANAGDWNGDGFDDLLISASGADDSSGRVYLVYGHSEFDLNSLDLSALTASDGVTFLGPEPGARLGEVLSSAGDLNGDGLSDIVIGASYSQTTDTDAGLYVIYGQSSFVGTFDLGEYLFSSTGFTISGISNNEDLSVVSVDDVTGDNIDDLLIGDADAGEVGGSVHGQAYLIKGSTNDFYQDYSSFNLDLLELDGGNGYMFSGEVLEQENASNAGIGFSVSAAGDQNGDTLNDFMISAPFSRDGDGETFLIFGGEDRLSYLDDLSDIGDGRIELADVGDIIDSSPPQAGDDQYSRNIGSAWISWQSPLGNDYSPDDLSLFIQSLDTSTLNYGTAGIDAPDGYMDNPAPGSKFFYHVDIDEYFPSETALELLSLSEGESVTDQLQYTIIDGLGGTDTATITFTLNGENNAPQAKDNVLLVDGTADSYAVNVLNNDFDFDRESVLTLVSVSDPDQGSVVFSGDGTIVFTPDENFIGDTSFTYTIVDETGLASEEATVWLPKVDNYAGTVFVGEVAYNYAGSSVSGAGDFNNDGIDDIIIGGCGNNLGVDWHSGSAYIVFGRENGFPEQVDLDTLNGDLGLRIHTNQAYLEAGFSVANAGDINHDGIDDIIIGTGQDLEFTDDGLELYGDGTSFVVFGSEDFDNIETIDLSTLNGENGFVIERDGALGTGNSYSTDVAYAGDVNADGFDDIIVGLTSYETSMYDDNSALISQRVGRAYVIYGSDDSFSSLVSLNEIENGSGENGFAIQGTRYEFYDFYGFCNSVSGGGDFNNDGISDLVVGGAYYMDDSHHYGSFILYGGTSLGDDGIIDVKDLTSDTGLTILGSQSYRPSGIDVSLGGDFNGDDISDLIIVSENSVPDSNYAGEVHVVFGGTDLDSDTLSLGDLDGSNGFTLQGVQYWGGMDAVAANAGDINNDGIDDILIGAKYVDSNGNNNGESYLVFGSDEAFPATLNLATLYGINGYRFAGQDGGDQLGSSVAAAGDINNDGIDDFIIGAGGAEPALNDSSYWTNQSSGEVYVVYGGNGSLALLDEIDGTVDGSISLRNLGLGVPDDPNDGDSDDDGDGNDPTPYTFTLSSSDESLLEGDNGNTPLSFTIQRLLGSTGAVTVNYEISGCGTNAAGSDDIDEGLPYAGSVEFGENEIEKTVTVNVTGDYTIEPNEQFMVSLTTGNAPDDNPVEFVQDSSIITIVNDDTSPVINVRSDGNVVEGDSGETLLSFTVSRTGAMEDRVTVEYSLDGSGISPADASDFSTSFPTTGQVVFEPGETQATVSVAVSGDIIVESDESVSISIDSAGSDLGRNVDIQSSAATAHIMNDDQPSVVSVEHTKQQVQEDNPGVIEFLVTRSGELDSTVDVDYFVTTESTGPQWAPTYTLTLPEGRLRYTGVERVDETHVFQEEFSNQTSNESYTSISMPFATEEDLLLKNLLLDFTLPEEYDLTLFSISLADEDSMEFFDYAYGFEVGLEIQLDSPSLGNFSLDYPVQATLVTPSLAIDGEEFTIGTTNNFYANEAELTAESLNFSQLGFNCFYSIDQMELSNISLVEVLGQPLIELPDFQIDPIAKDDIELFTIKPAGVETELFSLDDIEFKAGFPDGEEESVKTDSQIIGSLQPLSLSIEETLASIEINPLELLAKFPALKWLDFLQEDETYDLPGGYTLEAAYTLLEPLISGGYGIVQELTFTPDPLEVLIDIEGQQQQGVLGELFSFTAENDTDSMMTGTIEYLLSGSLDVTYSLAPIGQLAVDIFSASLKLTGEDNPAEYELSLDPVFSKSVSGSSDFGKIELYSREDIEIGSEYFESIVQKINVSVGQPMDGAVISGTVTFAPGETEKIITLPVVADNIAETNARVDITLSGAVSDAGAVVIDDETASTTVIDDDIEIEVINTRPLSIWGDPHLKTADGLLYEFQAVGEFTLLRSIDDPLNPLELDPINIQVRTKAVSGSDLVSANSAVAFQFGQTVVMVDSDSPVPLSIDGVETPLSETDEPIYIGDNLIYVDGDQYSFRFANGEFIQVDVFSDRIDIGLGLDSGRSNLLEGLLGNGNSDSSDDLQLPDGTVLDQPVSFDTLYGEFADGWRVTDETSLFVYEDGKTTEDYQNYDFPVAHLTLDSLPEDVLANAIAVVDEFGITDSAIRDAAIFDYAMTGDVSYAQSALNASINTVQTDEETQPTQVLVVSDAPVLDKAVGISAAQSAVQEGASDEITPLTFNLYRLGDVSDALSVAYSISGDIGNLAGNQGTEGIVEFLADQSMVSFSIEITGDDVPEMDESIIVKIQLDQAAHPDVLVAGASAQTTLTNDDGPLPTALSIEAYDTSQSEGGTYTFRLVRSGNTADSDEVSYRVLAADEAGIDAETYVDENDFGEGAFADQVVTFSPGETSKIVKINVEDDPIFEVDEIFAVRFESTDIESDPDFSQIFHSNILNNDAIPEPINDMVNLTAGETVSGNILENDTDDNPLIITSINGSPALFDEQTGKTSIILGSGVAVQLDSSGNFSITAQSEQVDELADGEILSQEISYTVSDGYYNVSAVLSINIAGQNDSPVGINDYYEITENVSLTGDVLSNDYDIDGDSLSVVRINGNNTLVGNSFALASGATLMLAADGFFSFDPSSLTNNLAVNETVNEMISYTVSDGNGGLATQTVEFNVIGVNDTPDANPDKIITLDEDSSALALGITYPTDPDNDSLMITVNSVPDRGVIKDPEGNVVTVGDELTDAQLTGLIFTLNVDFNGDAGSFIYEVTDGNGGSDTQTVGFDVTPVVSGYAPDVDPDKTITLDEDSGSTPLDIKAPSDADGDAFILSVTDTPDNGIIVDHLGNAVSAGEILSEAQLTGLSFIPVNDFNGDAGSFSYQVDDLVDGISSQTIDFTVNPMPEAPEVPDFDDPGSNILGAVGIEPMGNDSVEIAEQMGGTDLYDYYKFGVYGTSDISISFNGTYRSPPIVMLMNSSGLRLAYADRLTSTLEATLDDGEYYVCMRAYDRNAHDYNLKLDIQSSNPLLQFAEDIGTGGSDFFKLDSTAFGSIGDDFMTPADDSSIGVGVGGPGSDTYIAKDGKLMIVADSDTSGGDGMDTLITAINPQADDGSYMKIIDNRHLFMGNDLSGEKVLILDWQSNTDRIEQFELGGEQFSNDDLLALSEIFENADWSSDPTGLGLDADTVDQAMAYYADKSDFLEDNIELLGVQTVQDEDSII